MPTNTLSATTAENLAVALFYGLDPDIVENWTFNDFADRLEFMRIQNYIAGSDE